MYESPITIKTEDIARNIMDKQEEYILTQVQMCVDVDKEELIKALKYDREQYEKGWNDRDNEIVRCKDCKYYEETDSRIGTCLLTISGAEVDGFCAWGEWGGDGDVV